MVNCALQKYRNGKQLHAVIHIDNIPDAAFSNEEILSHLGVKELLQLVQQLSPAFRNIFNLYVFEGMKHIEIAEHLGISEGTSKSNLSDARAFLRKAVNKSLQSANKILKNNE